MLKTWLPLSDKDMGNLPQQDLIMHVYTRGMISAPSLLTSRAPTTLIIHKTKKRNHLHI